MPRWLLALPVMSALALAAAPVFAGNPYEELFGRKPKLWTDPDARFSIDLPIGWKAKHLEGQSHVEFHKSDKDRGLAAKVTVETRTLPPKTRLNHFMLRVQEEVKSVARNYTPIDQDKMTVSGLPARRVLFTHQYRGNAQITFEVVQVILLDEARGFVITLETAQGARSRFWEEFNLMVKGFSVHAMPATSRSRPRTGKKKLRAGELVNPDALQY